MTLESGPKAGVAMPPGEAQQADATGLLVQRSSKDMFGELVQRK